MYHAPPDTSHGVTVVQKELSLCEENEAPSAHAMHVRSLETVASAATAVPGGQLRTAVHAACPGERWAGGRHRAALRDILDNPRKYTTHLFSHRGTVATARLTALP